MTRLTNKGAPPLEVDVMFDLELGPDPGPNDFTEEELRLGWEAYGGGMLRDSYGRGRRPWAYWKFEIGEEPPEGDEQPRLAELGLLLDEEYGEVVEHADMARERLASGETFYHGAGEACRKAVELHERVETALAARRGTNRK